MRDKTIVWLLFGLLVVFNVVDALQTIMLLDLGEEEANPIFVALIGEFGVGSLWWFKTLMLCLLAAVILWDSHIDRKNKRDNY